MASSTVKPNHIGNDQSSELKSSPHLTPVGLTVLLFVMCFVPVVTILQLWRILPPVYEGELKAAVSAQGLPPASFYENHYSERPEVPTGQLIVRNLSDQDWTHLNIQINHHYQIYDTEPIKSGQTRLFDLDRFVNRTGARFSLRYNPLRFVRVYARRPTKDRATFEFDFEQNGFPVLD